ncbi:MAG: hypothetical protein JWN90_546 [Parcubacteria group bacterium]|nr:hypothetical protein [Parcubacteria group bacterium]
MRISGKAKIHASLYDSFGHLETYVRNASIESDFVADLAIVVEIPDVLIVQSLK